MKRRAFLAASLGALTAAGAQQPVAPERPIQLFNGRDLEGWYTWLRDSRYEDPKRIFSVVDGQLRISGEEWGGVATRTTYRDYHLIVEWRWGNKTWGNRVDKARDSGILIHGTGEDGAAAGVWLESIESQVIEGGSGDIIFVKGKNQPSGVRKDGTRTTARIDWPGRSPQWKDVLGFRGADDVESRHGEWNRQEIFASGSDMTCVLNGKAVNEVRELTHTAGKIQIQSEGAEIFIRKVELRPLPAGRPDAKGR